MWRMYHVEHSRGTSCGAYVCMYRSSRALILSTRRVSGLKHHQFGLNMGFDASPVSFGAHWKPSFSGTHVQTVHKVVSSRSSNIPNLPCFVCESLSPRTIYLVTTPCGYHFMIDRSLNVACYWTRQGHIGGIPVTRKAGHVSHGLSPATEPARRGRICMVRESYVPVCTSTCTSISMLSVDTLARS